MRQMKCFYCDDFAEGFVPERVRGCRAYIPVCKRHIGVLCKGLGKGRDYIDKYMEVF